jgi:hypothetical protein
MRDKELNEKKGSTPKFKNFDVSQSDKGVNPVLEIYFKEAPLARASLMFPTR